MDVWEGGGGEGGVGGERGGRGREGEGEGGGSEVVKGEQYLYDMIDSEGIVQ